MARAQHHRGKKSVMHECADLVFLYESTLWLICHRSACVCVGVCMWVVVWDVCLLRRLLTVYIMRHLTACFYPLLIFSLLFSISIFHTLSSLLPLHHASVILSHACHLSPLPWIIPPIPRSLSSLIPPTPADFHPHPARRCVNMASLSSLTCVAPSGTASSLCWRYYRSRFHPVSTSRSSSNRITSGRSRGQTLVARSSNSR